MGTVPTLQDYARDMNASFIKLKEGLGPLNATDDFTKFLQTRFNHVNEHTSKEELGQLIQVSLDALDMLGVYPAMTLPNKKGQRFPLFADVDNATLNAINEQQKKIRNTILKTLCCEDVFWHEKNSFRDHIFTRINPHIADKSSFWRNALTWKSEKKEIYDQSDILLMMSTRNADTFKRAWSSLPANGSKICQSSVTRQRISYEDSPIRALLLSDDDDANANDTLLDQLLKTDAVNSWLPAKKGGPDEVGDASNYCFYLDIQDILKDANARETANTAQSERLKKILRVRPDLAVQPVAANWKNPVDMFGLLTNGELAGKVWFDFLICELGIPLPKHVDNLIDIIRNHNNYDSSENLDAIVTLIAGAGFSLDPDPRAGSKWIDHPDNQIVGKLFYGNGKPAFENEMCGGYSRDLDDYMSDNSPNGFRAVLLAGLGVLIIGLCVAALLSSTPIGVGILFFTFGICAGAGFFGFATVLIAPVVYGTVKRTVDYFAANSKTNKLYNDLAEQELPDSPEACNELADARKSNFVKKVYGNTDTASVDAVAHASRKVMINDPVMRTGLAKTQEAPDGNQNPITPPARNRSSTI
jgi:hypothetical protein